MSLFPAIFIGHGSPENVILNNIFTKSLSELSKKIPRPKGIVVVSAHWPTRGTFVTTSENPEQIYDFYGFPQELYEVKYSPKGYPKLADEIISLGKDIPVKADDNRGIDHGAWTILKHIYPDQSIPVIQLSIDFNKSEEENYKIGKVLRSLREKEILIIGSGNIVHNLGMINFNLPNEGFDWAIRFDSFAKEALLKNNLNDLFNYKEIMKKDGALSVPTNDHYLPMFYVEAIKNKDDKLTWIYEGFDYGSISMCSYIIGG
jgi:4,5-DOPA dioxygenase extradiol